MEIADFAIQAQDNDQIRPFLEDIAAQAEKEAHFERGEMYDFEAQVSTAALMLASSAVFILIRYYSDKLQNDIVKTRLEIIRDLTKDGWDNQQATATVTALFDQQSKNNSSERALSAVRTMLGK